MIIFRKHHDLAELATRYFGPQDGQTKRRERRKKSRKNY
jgi:hypothetical protein